MDDPFAGKFLGGGPPDLDAMAAELPRPRGEPALDPDDLARECGRLADVVDIDLGHPLLDRSVLVGLASVDLTFEGRHPRYGRGPHGQARHDGFPPTIISAVDALLSWGLDDRAFELLTYWLERFVHWDTGEIFYYGPSLSEYGQLLKLAARTTAVRPLAEWPPDARRGANNLAGRLLRLADEAGDGLVLGVPEADESGRPGRFFHNNAWIARGLSEWADVTEDDGEQAAMQEMSRSLTERTLTAIRETWPDDCQDWWLPPRLEPTERPENLRTDRLAAVRVPGGPVDARAQERLPVQFVWAHLLPPGRGPSDRIRADHAPAGREGGSLLPSMPTGGRPGRGISAG